MERHDDHWTTRRPGKGGGSTRSSRRPSSACGERTTACGPSKTSCSPATTSPRSNTTPCDLRSAASPDDPHARPGRPARVARSRHHPAARQARKTRLDRARPSGRQPPHRLHRHHRRREWPCSRSCRNRSANATSGSSATCRRRSCKELVALLRAAREPHEPPEGSWQ